jgi:glycine/D-amino acid oxidase-like deaminating enzyme
VPTPYHAPFGALRVRDGGWLEPGPWLAALTSSARAHGVEVRTGASVARLSGGAGAAWRLAGVDGAALATAATVVVAVGADAAPATTFDGTDLAWPSWIRTRGEVVTLEGGPAFELPVAGGVYGASLGDQAWVGGGHRPADEDDPDAPANLREAFAWSLPGLAAARIASVWSGVRAKRGDARPVVDELAPGLWTFGAFAGRGFLCAAWEAERWIARWRRDAAADPRGGANAGAGTGTVTGTDADSASG